MISEYVFKIISPLSNLIAENSTATIFIIIVSLVIIVILGRLIIKMSGKNEALKNEFITIIAHKYHTPLTKVKWLAESLLANETDPYKKESLQNINQSNEELIKLTGTLIEMTDSNSLSKAAYSFEKIDICQLVKNIAEAYKNDFHQKNLFLSIKCPETPLNVKADRARIEFAIETLVSNACVYTPPGKNVDITVNQLGSKAEISVTDNGIGIDHADLPNIFTKFFRTNIAQTTDTEGFGVALYLARSIVKKHKGKIEVTSPGINLGSKFRITLPIVR